MVSRSEYTRFPRHFSSTANGWTALVELIDVNLILDCIEYGNNYKSKSPFKKRSDKKRTSFMAVTSTTKMME